MYTTQYTIKKSLGVRDGEANECNYIGYFLFGVSMSKPHTDNPQKWMVRKKPNGVFYWLKLSEQVLYLQPPKL